MNQNKVAMKSHSNLMTDLQKQLTDLIAQSEIQANRVIPDDCTNREFELKRINMALGKKIAYKHVLSLIGYD